MVERYDEGYDWRYVVRSLYGPHAGMNLDRRGQGRSSSSEVWADFRSVTLLLGLNTSMRSSFEGDSHVEWFEGNYEEYEQDRRKRLGADADTPHRIKYRRLDA